MTARTAPPHLSQASGHGPSRASGGRLSRAFGGSLPRALGALSVGVVLALGGCTTGSDAVEVNNGGEFRFVAGTPAGEVIPEPERASAPQFGGTLLDGAAFDSAELTGDVAVLNFWGSWCAPCRVETPEFQRVYSEVAEQGVQFLGLNVKDTEALARAFLETNAITFPSLYDPRGEVALAFRDYPANNIPSTIVLDRDGRVAAVYTGEVATDDLRAVVQQLVGEA